MIEFCITDFTRYRDRMNEKVPVNGSDLATCVQTFQAHLLTFQQQLEQILPAEQQIDWQRSLSLLAAKLETLSQPTTPAPIPPVFSPPYSEDQWRSLSACLPVGIFTVDVQGNCTYINPYCEEIIGYTLEEALGEGWMRFIHPDDLDHVLPIWKAAIQSGQPYMQEFRIRTPQESIRWLSSRTSPILSEQGAVLGHTGTIEDITKQKLAEAQVKASLHEKEALLKEIHHRVKNNLQIISSLIYLQAQRVEDSSVRQLFEDSQSRISSMALVHDSLYRSQDFAHINLSEYVQMLTASLFNTYRIQPELVKLSVQVDEGVIVSLDKAIPCGLILNELMTNALKHGFSDNQTGEVRVLLKNEPCQVCLVVENDGNSLPEIFELQKIQSMGLRLVNALVSQLKGQFELEKTTKTQFKVIFDRT